MISRPLCSQNYILKSEFPSKKWPNSKTAEGSTSVPRVEEMGESRGKHALKAGFQNMRDPATSRRDVWNVYIYSPIFGHVRNR